MRHKSTLLLLVTICALVFSAMASAQDDPPPGGGTPVWVKTVDTAEVVKHYTTSLYAYPVTPNTVISHNFTELYKVWDVVNEDSSLTAPWTAAFSTLYDFTANGPVSATSNGDGQITWYAHWEDCTEDGGGTPARQHWFYGPTSKNKERKMHYKTIDQGFGI
jgi:hypothetical protein